MSAKPIKFLTYCKRKVIYMRAKRLWVGRDGKSMLNVCVTKELKSSSTSLVLRFCHFSDQKMLCFFVLFPKCLSIFAGVGAFQHFMLWMLPMRGFSAFSFLV